MPTQIEELSTEIQSLETSLAGEKDESKKADILKTLTEKKGKHAELVSDEKSKVPYHKFQKVNENLKLVMDKLAEYEAKEKAKQDDELKKAGEFQKLLDLKETENKQLKTQLEQLIGERKQEKINSILLKEISKKDPHDAEDVLRLIDRGKLTVKEVDNGIVVDGVDTELENLKNAKPHLFKVVNNDNRQPGENGKPNAGTMESVEAEFKILQAKAQLTPIELARMRTLSEQLIKFRAAAGKK
jgi:hypothetical protein